MYTPTRTYARAKLNSPFTAAGTPPEAGAWEKLAPRCCVGAVGRGVLWGGGAEVCLGADGVLTSRCDVEDDGEDEGDGDADSSRAEGGGGSSRRACGACCRAREAMLLRLVVVVVVVSLAVIAGLLVLLPPIAAAERPNRRSLSSGTSVCPVRTL